MKMYKYIDSYTVLDEEGARVEELILLEYNVIKETPKGKWILVGMKRKFVLNADKSSKKRFAHISKEDALVSFIKRKEHQAGHIRFQLKRVERAIVFAKENNSILSKNINTIYCYSQYGY